MSERQATYTATPEREPDEHLKPWRCWRCGALLAKLYLIAGCAVEVKCRCNAVNVAKIPGVDKGAPTT